MRRTCIEVRARGVCGVGQMLKDEEKVWNAAGVQTGVG